MVTGTRAGLAVTIGFVAVFSAAGLLAGSLHAVLMAVAPWLMIAVATAIVALGIMAVRGKTVPMHFLPGFRSGAGVLPMIGFGIAYAVGSLSCSLPVFIAAVGGALTTESALVTAAVVVAYGLGMGLLAIVLALIASLVGAVRFGRLRRIASGLPRAAGVVCIVIGVYLIGYWVGQAGGPQLVAPITRVLETAQQGIVGAIERAWLPIGVGAAAFVLAALIVAAHLSRGPASGAASPPPTERRTRDTRR
ncbi:cytochrome c biogenesis CcdA family protein [Microbacterium elymi]|uniref:Cytochrome C biogenesis protein transmembrane domain-containing protein n=1 Tax=Microbacterium elymi TaxID=2909587 RepID=A0ABY5NMG3_9MICO|nr:cytochrome c biogenesis protein CcdA [Microbacterium elymi]UUT36323.1 hypothetical protein L2X98_25575 [Microbacterium elymi]